MKVTKSQLKELIRHAIVELTEKTFGSQAQYDAYRKKHNLKPGSKHKVAGKTVTVRDTKKMSKKTKSLGDRMADKLNKRMADLEKKRKQGKIKESKKRRYTVKEVRMWMKKLEENRYKKVYNSDARRVAWMVNNEGRTLDEMPMSMKKKWSKAQYGRERYLATEFLKSKSEQMNEGKLTEGFKKIAKKKVKYKTKMSGTVFSFDWEIESGIDTDVMGGNTPKIILHYVRTELEGEYKGDKVSGGNTFWLKHKNGKPYTPQEAKKLVNKIANKKTKFLFIDDQQHNRMIHQKVTYMKIHPYNYGIQFKTLVDKYMASKLVNILPKKERETRIPVMKVCGTIISH